MSRASASSKSGRFGRRGGGLWIERPHRHLLLTLEKRSPSCLRGYERGIARRLSRRTHSRPLRRRRGPFRLGPNRQHSCGFAGDLAGGAVEQVEKGVFSTCSPVGRRVILRLMKSKFFLALVFIMSLAPFAYAPPIEVVPEPSTFAAGAILLGIAAVAAFRRRRK